MDRLGAPQTRERALRETGWSIALSAVNDELKMVLSAEQLASSEVNAVFGVLWKLRDQVK